MESGRELHKENIQPLSSGRNISLMKLSDDTSKSEHDVEQQVSELESNVQNYCGDDPIEPYLALIRFLEHQSLQTITWKKALASARMDCYKKFYDNPKYQNDKRYVEAIVKCLNEAIADPGSRLNLLLIALTKKEIGKIVSQMYIVIAEHQESLGKANEARVTLKHGIENNAQPVDKLQEAISELEFRIARDLAKSMNVGQLGDSRNFGTSVPMIGDKNDATVFRNDLRPAVPVMERQISLPKLQKGTSGKGNNINLYTNEGENEPTSSSGQNLGFNTVEHVVEAKYDKENKLNPSKWNKSDVVVAQEPRDFEPAPRERITIFTEENTEVANHLRSTVQEGVLKERKPDSASDLCLEPELQIAITTPIALPLQIPSNGGGDISSVDGPQIIPNARLMCSRALLHNGNPASFEHRHREAWKRKNQDREIIVQLRNEKIQLENKLFVVQRDVERLREAEESLHENFETERKQKSIKEAKWEQQRYSYNDTILRLTTECSELKEYVQQLRLGQKESTQSFEATRGRHCAELEELKATHAERVEELITQLALAQRGGSLISSSNTCEAITKGNSNSNSSGSRQYSSSSNENECTFVKTEQQQHELKMSLSQSKSIILPSDKLLNGTGMSYMESFMAPPSCAAEITGTNEIEVSVNPEPSFNASVRMGGATTVYGWNEKTRFCFNSSNADDSPGNRDGGDVHINVTGNDTAPSFSAVMLPPPPSVSKKFVLYESMSDSQSISKGKKPEMFSHQSMENPQGVDIRSLPENIPPVSAVPIPPEFVQPGARISNCGILTPRSRSVSARIAEIEAISSGHSGVDANDENRYPTVHHARDENPGIVGQTFTRPMPRRRSMAPLLRKDDMDDDEPPFEPYTSTGSRFEPYRPPELPFDVSNLTSALQFDPPPLLNSTPQRCTFSGGTRRTQSDIYAGNYVHTQRIPQMQEIIDSGEADGPMSPENEARRARERWMHDWTRRKEELRDHPPNGIDESIQLNLSPIQETSKENRSSCTTGSSSGNMTSTRGGGTMSGVSMFTSSNSRSVSGAHRFTYNNNQY